MSAWSVPSFSDVLAARRTSPRNERRRGLIAMSTGNLGQSVAFAARLFGVTARICIPRAANPVKVAAMEGLG